MPNDLIDLCCLAVIPRRILVGEATVADYEPPCLDFLSGSMSSSAEDDFLLVFASACGPAAWASESEGTFFMQVHISSVAF